MYDTKGNKVLDLELIDCSLTMESDDKYAYSKGKLASVQYPRNKQFTFTCDCSNIIVYMNNKYKYNDEKEFMTIYDSSL